jgi:hypothetical protein
MSGALGALDVVRTLADIAILPLLGVLWNIQGRLSRIEGMLNNSDRKEKRP